MDNLLSKCTNDPMQKKRIIRYSIIVGVSLAVLIIIIIIVVAAKGGDDSKSNSSSENDSGSEEISDSCPEIKYISSSFSGSGFASRYWDCCKPSCSWKENSPEIQARQCDKNMNLITDASSKSMCEGGPATTCLSQIPFTINGCDNIGFAFAACPTTNACGRCALLEFTGEGKYETRENHKKLKGKKLIVMASNIGYDVNEKQFDIMIPGGGVGAFNGCANILGTNLGKQYGGFLSDCEDEVGWNDESAIYSKRKECLINKCNSIFSNNYSAKEGCLFLATFLEAAGNPLHTFKEIECPQVLKDRY